MLLPSALAAAVSAAAFSQSSETVVATLPTEMCRTYFFVSLEVSEKEGRPDDRRLWLLYDTGAASTFVDPDSVEGVSGTDVRGNKRVNFTNAKIGPLSVNRLSAGLIDLDHLSMALGREIDGIFAYDAFGDHMVTLDYQAGEIRLSEGELPAPDRQTIFSAQGKDKRPWISVRVDGRRRKILVDSGAGSDLSLNRLSRYDTKEAPVVTGISTRFKRLETNETARLDGDLTFGDHTIVEPMLDSVPKTELFGGGLMQHYRITFDVENKRMRWKQITDDPITSDSQKTFGVTLKPAANGLEVEAQLDGLEVDLQPGDVLTHFSGVPAAQRGCDALGGGGEVTATRLRDGISEDLVIPVLTAVE